MPSYLLPVAYWGAIAVVEAGEGVDGLRLTGVTEATRPEIQHFVWLLEKANLAWRRLS